MGVFSVNFSGVNFPRTVLSSIYVQVDSNVAGVATFYYYYIYQEHAFVRSSDRAIIVPYRLLVVFFSAFFGFFVVFHYYGYLNYLYLVYY